MHTLTLRMFNAAEISNLSVSELFDELQSFQTLTEESLAYGARIYARIEEVAGGDRRFELFKRSSVGRLLARIAFSNLSPKLALGMAGHTDKVLNRVQNLPLAIQDQVAMDAEIPVVKMVGKGCHEIVFRPLERISPREIEQVVRGSRLLTESEQVAELSQSSTPGASAPLRCYTPRLDPSGDKLIINKSAATNREVWAVYSAALGFDVEQLIIQHQDMLARAASGARGPVRRATQKPTETAAALSNPPKGGSSVQPPRRLSRELHAE